MDRLFGTNKRYYFEIQELITFISINIPNITFTIESMIEAIDQTNMTLLEKEILKRWLDDHNIQGKAQLQIRGFNDNNDVVYRIFDMDGNNWDEIVPLLIEPLFIVCDIEYVLDLSGIIPIENVNFEETRKYIDLEVYKIKYDISEVDIDNTNIITPDKVSVENNSNNSEIVENIDQLRETTDSRVKPVDYTDIETKYKENPELLESLKKLREMNIL